MRPPPLSQRSPMGGASSNSPGSGLGVRRVAWAFAASLCLNSFEALAQGATPNPAAPAAPAATQSQDWEYEGPARRPPSQRVCMDDREQKAEALIRTGIILREIGRECAKRNVDATLLPAWNAFDAANADQIQAATRLRQGALERNYPDRPNIQRDFDDRLIASRGLTTISNEECTVAGRLLKSWTSYNDLVKHSARTELGRVRSIFPKCSTQNNRRDR